MAFKFMLFLLSSLFVFISPSAAKTSFRPKALILPVFKDTSILQYVTHINQRTPLVPLKLNVDLGGDTLWVDCEQGYVSSSFRSVNCRSAHCALARPVTCFDTCNQQPRLWFCNKNACCTDPDNPVTRSLYYGSEVSEDVLSVRSTTGQLVSVPRFVFTCVPTLLRDGLSNGTQGIAGLGRSRVALPTQLAQAFSFQRKFALCLSSSAKSSGVILFGDAPYVMLPHIDISKSLMYTPLLTNPIGTRGDSRGPSTEYFIGLKSIKINGKAVPLKASLLSIDESGYGGTKISTVNPYTMLEGSIYKAVIEAFIEELPNASRVASVPPFGACFNSKLIPSTRVGPAVPNIDLVLQNLNVYWTIFGANSMVQVRKDILCLGFVENQDVIIVTPIVIGAHQIEDNFLEFDLARSRLGFSSSLLLRQTTCANYNTTSHA